MSHKRNLRITLALSVAALAVAPVPGAQAASVCNEAGNGHRGPYVATGTPDPDKPARYKTDLAGLGNWKAKGNGLDHAADRSPALTQCGLPGDDGGETNVLTDPSPGDLV